MKTKSLLLLGLSSLPAAAGATTPLRPVLPNEVPAGMAYDVKPDEVADSRELRGYRIAVLASHGVQDIELEFPLRDLEARGARVDVYAPSWVGSRVLLVDFVKPTKWAPVRGALERLRPSDYDLLLVPGGAWSTQVLRKDAKALETLLAFHRLRKTIAIICSGAQVLIDSGLAKGRDVTGTPSVRADLENAGGRYLDQPVVRSGNLIMSRSPGDLVEFTRAVRETLATRR